MRVSKVVREYIENQVCAKVEPKYEADRLLVGREETLIKEAIKKAKAEARNAFINSVTDFAKANPFVVLDEDFADSISTSYYFSSIKSANNAGENNPYHWQRRMRKEIEEKVANIIVTLELGGNKDDLEKLLSEI